MATNEHLPVLTAEVLAHLLKVESGIFVDATFGRGGHSRALLQALSGESNVIALDRDQAAVAEARTLASVDARFEIHHAAFSKLEQILGASMGRVSGVLMDLGVSSPQLDDARRGFSFLQPGPLDMRMDVSQALTAATWLNQAGEEEIADTLYQYGEERRSRAIARAIVEARPLEGARIRQLRVHRQAQSHQAAHQAAH